MAVTNGDIGRTNLQEKRQRDKDEDWNEDIHEGGLQSYVHGFALRCTLWGVIIQT